MDGRIPAPKGASIPTEQAARPVLASDILERASDLIEPEGRWTQGAFSRDERGEARYGGGRWAKEPVCWCAIGAIAHVQQKSPDETIRDNAHLLLEKVVGEGVEGWNDRRNRTQAEVVAALRAAAEKARTAAETGAVGMEPQSGGMRP